VLTAGRIGLRSSLILPTALSGVLAWGAALGIGLWLRSLDTQRRATTAAVRRDERLELARELHDAVAHHIAAIVVQAQAARLAAAKHPEHLPQTLTAIESAGGDALTAMRRVVGLLRDTDDPPTDAPGAEALDDLVRRFSTRVRSVRAELPENQDDWPPELRSTAYRIVQEALTNIARHAPEAQLVQVRVAADGAEVRIEVTDDGDHRSADRPRSGPGDGYGLIGMQERVAALGGAFQAGRGPEQGWSVRATIPRTGVPS
jgi:signal transduction histidine kinase